MLHVKAYGVDSDLDEHVRVVADWVDFQTESVAALNEIMQSIPLLSVRAPPCTQL